MKNNDHPAAMLRNCTFARAIILHAIGYSVRRASWPKGQRIQESCDLRVPRTPFLATIHEWDPTEEDMAAADWEVDPTVPRIDRLEASP